MKQKHSDDNILFFLRPQWGFVFRFNNRHNPFLLRDTLIRLLASSNLEYKELTKESAA
jgi:hypothetical protein